MGVQPSASKSATLVHCSYAFSPELDIPEDTGSAASRYGSAFHDVTANLIQIYVDPKKAFDLKVKPRTFDAWIEAAAKKWRLPTSAAQELVGHVWSSFGVLHAWLSGANPWNTDWRVDSEVEVETSYGIQVVDQVKGTPVRRIDPPSEEGHRYVVEEGELPGTLDLQILKPGVPPLTLDHKTGSSKNFSEPHEDDQMKTLALIPDVGEAIVAINHADRRSLPMIYGGELGPGDLKSHRQKLKTAFLRIGDGSMNPGPWCDHCPALDVCPTKYAEVIPTTLALVGTLDGGISDGLAAVKKAIGAIAKAEDVGRLHLIINQIGKLEKMARDEIRSWVEDHPSEIVVRPDGKILGFEPREYEKMKGKTKLVEELGALEADRLFKKLRTMGVMETEKRVELHARADKGG